MCIPSGTRFYIKLSLSNYSTTGVYQVVNYTSGREDEFTQNSGMQKLAFQESIPGDHILISELFPYPLEKVGMFSPRFEVHLFYR